MDGLSNVDITSAIAAGAKAGFSAGRWRNLSQGTRQQRSRALRVRLLCLIGAAILLVGKATKTREIGLCAQSPERDLLAASSPSRLQAAA